jgi:hypothetical protein
MNISNAIFQLGNIHQLPIPMGTDKTRAVKADNCWGERLLVENMGSKSFSKGKGNAVDWEETTTQTYTQLPLR